MISTSINGEQINLYFDKKLGYWVWTYQDVKYVSKRKPMTDEDVANYEFEANQYQEMANDIQSQIELQEYNMMIEYMIANLPNQ